MIPSRRATRQQAAGRRVPSGLRGVRGQAQRIVTLGAADAGMLRMRARAVPAVDASTRRLIADMVATMRRSHGIGLAAPQIGVPLRVLVAGSRQPPLAVVNPRLVKRWGSQLGAEGCLSIPGIYADVRRAQRVVVTGQNARGRAITVRASGLLSRILQHEIDHLNGVLFIDRVAPDQLMRRLRAPRAARRRSAPGAAANSRRVRRIS